MFPQLHVLPSVRQEVCDPPAAGLRYTQLGELVPRVTGPLGSVMAHIPVWQIVNMLYQHIKYTEIIRAVQLMCLHGEYSLVQFVFSPLPQTL